MPNQPKRNPTKPLVWIAAGSAVASIVCAFAPPILQLTGGLTAIYSLSVTFGVVFTTCVGALTIEALR